ncbi:MAG TPA: TIGR03619 family F420-dependent LLM class oxidoreductase [Kineosporiaceae bacterium]|nr:TIGR03619 family F420-dependent LLM class oxidoreductase [Kineosporiaceae bacterium]
MQIGFALPVSGSWATPDNLLTIARRAEQLGYASLWSFQRLLAPPDNQIAPVYTSVLDPTVVLGYAAAVTERIDLGIAIINAPFESPALLAKQLATLDVLCKGRLLAGLGLGWLPAEFTASGVPFERRGARMDEYLRCLDALWGPDPVQFDGEFYQVPPSIALPKPVPRSSSARPPILMGGDARAALERIGRLGDGWISSSRVPPDEFGQRVEVVKAAAEAAGRDPDQLRFVCRGVLLDAPRTRPLTGTLAQIQDDLPGLAKQGVTDLFIDLNFDPTIGHVDADPVASMRRAQTVLEAFAPA